MSSKELSIVCNMYNDKKDSKEADDFIYQFRNFPPDLKSKFELILVDDCSPMPVEVQEQGIDTTLLRVDTDIPWNQPGARNLGFLVAAAPKILGTDADMRFTPEVIKRMIKTPADDKVRHCYCYKRCSNIPEEKGSYNLPNIFLISRKTWLSAQGYDEDFAGSYGYDDIALLDKIPKAQKEPRVFLVDFVGGLNTEALSRDTSVNGSLRAKKKNKKLAYSKDMLRFDWHVVTIKGGS